MGDDRELDHAAGRYRPPGSLWCLLRAGRRSDNAAYETWSDSTAGTRDVAGKAQAELERRGHKVPAWAPEDEHSEPRADQPERQAEAEPEQEAEPEASEPEASPEAAEGTGPGTEPEPELAEPGVV